MTGHGPALPAFDDLRRFSARVGADPRLVQGAGGNTSLKVGGVLWIKASGTWLARAAEDDIFVPVEMAPLLAAVEADAPEAEKAQAFVDPSIQSRPTGKGHPYNKGARPWIIKTRG